MSARAVQQRRCVVCRTSAQKTELIRFVQTVAGLAADLSGDAPGRGAYCHLRSACLSSRKGTEQLLRSLAVRSAGGGKSAGAGTRKSGKVVTPERAESQERARGRDASSQVLGSQVPGSQTGEITPELENSRNAKTSHSLLQLLQAAIHTESAQRISTGRISTGRISVGRRKQILAALGAAAAGTQGSRTGPTQNEKGQTETAQAGKRSGQKPKIVRL